MFPTFSALTHDIASGSHSAVTLALSLCNEKLSAQFTQGAHYITSTNFHLASTSLPDMKDRLFTICFVAVNSAGLEVRNGGEKRDGVMA